ncbi:MAG: sulfotransferase family protein [Bacteroidota bacterium]
MYTIDKPLRINLWSGPRNVSTALMYSFAQRADTKVFDEPIYAHYLRVTGIDHPGRAETLASMDHDGERVVREVILGTHDRPILFFKQMAHHLVDLDEGFMKDCLNLLLIRRPDEVVASFSKVISHPTMQDIGIKRQHQLYEDLLALGQQPLIIEGMEIRRQPEKMLSRFCEAIGIPFDPAMLAWEAGARPEDGSWAAFWYHNVHASTSFKPYIRQEPELAPHLRALVDEAQPFYEALAQHSLKID